MTPFISNIFSRKQHSLINISDVDAERHSERRIKDFNKISIYVLLKRLSTSISTLQYELWFRQNNILRQKLLLVCKTMLLILCSSLPRYKTPISDQKSIKLWILWVQTRQSSMYVLWNIVCLHQMMWQHNGQVNESKLRTAISKYTDLT